MGAGAYSWKKKMFQSKLHSSADQILFEFDGFCKPQSIKRQIHFNTS